MKAKVINKYTIQVTMDDGEVRVLTNKKAMVKAKKRREFIGNVIVVLIATAVISFFLYAWLCGPYDYWTKEGNVMVQYHVDWEGNETVIDSYELDPYYN